MKNKLICFALFALILTSCSPKQENLTGDVLVPKPLNEKTYQDSLKLVKLDSNTDFTLEDIEPLGFDRCIIKTQGLRLSGGNYRTDFKRKKRLLTQIDSLKESNISYYIEVTSGPGVSQDRKNLSLYKNKDDIVFFAQMVRELIELNKENPHFSGIILSIGDESIDRDVYYSTLEEISKRVVKDDSAKLILTVFNDFFEEDGTLPVEYFEDIDVGFNIDLDFNCEQYPGKATILENEVELSKNFLLNKFLPLKDLDTSSQDESEKVSQRQIIVSIKSPWDKGSSILVKDIFEVMKILGFEFSFSYANTDDQYDFSSNTSITHILGKY